MYKYFPHTDDDLRDMLRVVGVDTLDDLYADVPPELLLHRQLDIPSSQSEEEIRQHIGQLAAHNRRLVCMAGGGAYDHYTPAVVPYLAQRSEFSTCYTPYQAEISQGTLEYIFEYQTMMARLTGLDVSNASMYDGATATAEAMMMMTAASRKRNLVLLDDGLPTAVRRVVETYAHFHGTRLATFHTIDEARRQAADPDLAGAIVSQPDRLGYIHDLTALADTLHAHKALLAIHAPATTLALLRTPGEWGADIACGDAQSLGLPLAYGGPYIGYLCTTKALVRKMPGRLVGATTDADGKRVFVLTLQAREQHIRREKATSNICTAQGFLCLYVAIYLSLMGPQGLREVNRQSYGAAHQLHDALLDTGHFTDLQPLPFLNEFTLRYDGDTQRLRQRLAQEGILFGVPAEGHPDAITLALTEKNTPEQIERVAQLCR